jgi:hypothetical protein
VSEIPGPQYAYRGSSTEAYIKAERDSWGKDTDREGWIALDNLLDDYRLRADTGTKLLDPAPSDGGHDGD